MNRDVMSRQMFRNGGVVFMEEGGAAPVPSREDVEMAQIMEMIRQNDGRLPGPYGYEREGPIVENLPFIPGPEKDYIETILLSDPPIIERRYKDGRVEHERMPPTAPIDPELLTNPEPFRPYVDESRGSVQKLITDESGEVSKDMMKRLNNIFKTEYYGAPQLDEFETNRAYAMMLSPKGFTDEEIRELATNPSGRMLEYTRRQAEYDFNEDPVGIQDFAEGGMAMPAPPPAPPAPGPAAQGPGGMPPIPDEASLEAMPLEGVAQEASQLGVDPSSIQQLLGQVEGKLGNLENAESYEDVINSIREVDAPLEVRYEELATLVGEEDAMKTPESVLTLVQPIVMMSGIDQGIGALASEEMTAPVTGDLAGGIMSTINMGDEEVPPVNFNQGGDVSGAMPGGRLGQLYGEKRDLYRSILGKEDQEAAYDEQKNMTQAKILLDAAAGFANFAGGAGMPGRSPAEQLAAAASPVLQNIGARAGELNKFKQAQAKEARAMDLAALTAAEAGLTAELKAAADIEKQKKIGAQKMAQIELTDKLASARSRQEEKQKQEGRTELENLKFNNQKSLEKILQDNRQALKRLEGQNSREDIILADKLRKENAQISHELELSKMNISNTYELEKLDKLHEQSTELQKSRLGLQEAIAKNRLEFDKEQAKLTNARDDEKVEIQKRLAELKERDTKLKESAARIDLFGKGLQGKVKNILEGQGSAALADKYANNLTSPDETNMVEGAINYHTNDQKVWNSETARYDRVGANKLIDAWGEALKKRSTFEGASMPSVGEDEAKRLNLGAFAPPPAGGATPPAAGGAIPPAAGSEKIPEKGDTYKSLLAELQNAMEDATGRGAAIQSIMNRGSELVIGQPLFEGAAEAQDLLSGINSAAVNSIAKALPGKESDQWRAEMAKQMPPVAAFTAGPKTALNKTKGFIAYLNTEIDAMNERLASPKPERDIGELRQAASVLESYRNVYVKIRNKLDAAIKGSSSPELKEKRDSLWQFVKPAQRETLQGGMK